MERKCRKFQQAVCPFSGEKLIDNMTVDEMAKSLRASILFMLFCFCSFFWCIFNDWLPWFMILEFIGI